MADNQDNVDQAYIDRLIQIESGGNPRAKTGSNYGLGQFSPDQFRALGITNPYDPAQQIRAIQTEAGRNRDALSTTLGRAPDNAEHYIAHQQGLGGAQALFSNPNAPAWQVISQFYKTPEIAQAAIRGNIPSDSPLRNVPIDQISAKDFTDMWKAKFNREGTPMFSGVSASAPSGSVPIGAIASEPTRGRTLADLQSFGGGQPSFGGSFGGFNLATPQYQPVTIPQLPLTNTQPTMIPASRLLASYGGR